MVLDEVPEDTRLWNPDTAPQATVTNRMGNMVPSFSLLNPVKAGSSMVGWPMTKPMMAPAIMHTNIMVVI